MIASPTAAKRKVAAVGVGVGVGLALDRAGTDDGEGAPLAVGGAKEKLV
ncbi:hypothetical protein [Sinomonas albida]